MQKDHTPLRQKTPSVRDLDYTPSYRDDEEPLADAFAR